MKSTLIIPDSAMRQELKARQRTGLTWTADHPSSPHGHGVMLYSNGDILDGLTFRGLRDTVEARIETTDPDKVCRALGVPIKEPGIAA
jgi:hypothetical protein